MGTINIKRRTGNREYPVPEIDGELVIDESNPDEIALVVRGETNIDRVRVEENEPGLYYPREYVGDHPASLFLPTLAFVFLLVVFSGFVEGSVSALFGPRVLETVRVLVGVGYLVAGLFGSLSIYDDARARRANADWRPNPFLYLGFGAFVLCAFRLALTPSLAAWIRTPSAVACLLVVSVLLASTVAGPIYYVQRLRRSSTSAP